MTFVNEHHRLLNLNFCIQWKKELDPAYTGKSFTHSTIDYDKFTNEAKYLYHKSTDKYEQ